MHMGIIEYLCVSVCACIYIVDEAFSNILCAYIYIHIYETARHKLIQ